MKVLDVRDLRAPPTSPARIRLRRDLADAAQTLGAFALTLDPPMAAAAGELLALARAFFTLPPDVKCKYLPEQPNPRGYQPVPAAGDVREKFFFTQLGAETVAGPLPGANVDVAELPDFAARLEAAIAVVAEVGVALLTTLAPDVDVEPESVQRAFAPPGGAAGFLLHYPPVPLHEGRAGQGTSSHRDLHPLALIVQDELGGLEVHDGAQWVQADAQRFRIVCQMGESLATWTGGRTLANVHRVRSPTETSRFSVAVFLQPAPDTPLGPRPAPTFAEMMETWLRGLDDGTTGYADVG